MNNDSFRLRVSSEGTDLDVTGQWTRECEQALISGLADGLVLNYSHGYSEPNIDFLNSWPIKRLTILDRSLTDLSPIVRLSSTLRKLSVLTHPSVPLNLEELTGLKSISAHWTQMKSALPMLTELEDIFILGFNAPDLTVFGSNTRVERIHMKDRPKIESLAGFDELPQLRNLGIFLATRLNDFSALDSAGTNTVLEELHLPSCRKLERLDCITSLTALKVLDISDCGDIASLHPLSPLKQLEEFYCYGKTKIVDNDLSPLSSLPALRELRIKPRRSYHPTEAEIRAAADIP